MSITDIVKKFYVARQRQLTRYNKDAEVMQKTVLEKLVQRAKETEYGMNHLFSVIKDYDDFAKNVPVNTYEEIKADIDHMRHEGTDILWPGKVNWFAKSSGTTNDKSKFIPVTPEGLQNIHYAGSFDCVALYFLNNPKSRMFDGKALILGGSHAPNYNFSNSLVGDLSAILIENVTPLVNLVRVPKKKTALLSDFELKRERIALETYKKNVTNLSGVPSWMLSVLTKVLEVSGKSTIHDVWPNLEVFFHGGVSFNPYRQQYQEIINNPDMHYMETYNASEGFFGVQNDPNDPALLLLIDHDIFYEFIPMDEFDKPDRQIVPLSGIETGRNYAIVISTSCGLWRYIIGDTVMFTSKNPYKFVITGRTKHFINAFGEELIMDNAEKGLTYACEMTGAEVLEYTAAPIFMDHHAKCRHQWLIEFAKEPSDMAQFAHYLDTRLQEINSDYEAKRYKDITLQHLEIVKARPGLFNEWLKSKGKLGGQHKVPRLSNNRDFINELLEKNEKNPEKDNIIITT